MANRRLLPGASCYATVFALRCHQGLVDLERASLQNQAADLKRVKRARQYLGESSLGSLLTERFAQMATCVESEYELNQGWSTSAHQRDDPRATQNI